MDPNANEMCLVLKKGSMDVGQVVVVGLFSVQDHCKGSCCSLLKWF